ncbi:MAG: Ig-like domain repeat protein [Tessaracoccus sp.]|uniref:Ig-like domain-containing protein n=1 Tax=Tessaracoccus sp. TaxID=1971211 RepID=UPI001EBC3EA0|nr:Ig-like domain-containing protein [Tessaracoccus sp.]MBK7819843.1 Ig-like domain repeat protein [Tessaracoccus sp.]
MPRTAAPGQYRVRVVSGSVVRVTSPAFSVAAATTRVYNPGDHAGGTEDLLVQQRGSWTFRATAFAPNGTLRATAVIGGKTVTLGGIGQVGDGWKLDAKGDVGLTDYVRLTLPADAPIGQLKVAFTDGSKSVTRTLAVEGAAVAASVQVGATVEIGGTIRITGKGFVHPTHATQGSRIAVKIDDGAYSRLDDKVHSNRTVWYVIDAKKDGTFEVDMPLPDGTKSGPNGSDPAFAAGTHALRFLTGSLLAGDTSRTVKSTDFTVMKKNLTSTPTPTISGTKKVGKTLKATVKTWQPTKVTVKYQWLRDGKAISKATTSSYKLTKADAGKKVSVKVTGSKSGYTTVSKTSKTVTVAKVVSTVKVTVPKSVKKGTQATIKVTVSAATSKPTGKVTVTVNGKKVAKTVKASAKGKVSIKLPKISKAGSYKVKASFAPSGSTAKSTAKSTTVTKTLKVT